MKIIIFIVAMIVFVILAVLQYKERFVPLSPSYLLISKKPDSISKEKKSLYYSNGFANLVTIIILIVWIAIFLTFPIVSYFDEKSSIVTASVLLTNILILNVIKVMIVKIFNKKKLSTNSSNTI
ncbi:MAG: hypothetical protein ACK5K7_06765 [Bacilli bacterium]